MSRRKRSLTLHVLWVISETKIICCDVYEDGTVTWGRYIRTFRFVSVSNVCKRSFRHDFETGWSSFALCKYRETIFRLQTSKKMDRERRSSFVAFSISSLNPCDFFLCGYTKNQIYCEHSENITDRKAKLRHAISIIQKKQFKKCSKTSKTVFRL